MTDSNPIGQRIARYRKSAGIETAADLATRIGHPKITTSVIQNIESGRKQDLTVLQLLEIACAIRVSPLMLLVSMNDRSRLIDIPAVGEELAGMTVEEFDRWASMLLGAPIPTEADPWAWASTGAVSRLRELASVVKRWGDRNEDSAVDLVERASYLLSHLSAPSIDLSWVPDTLRRSVKSYELAMESEAHFRREYDSSPAVDMTTPEEENVTAAGSRGRKIRKGAKREAE